MKRTKTNMEDYTIHTELVGDDGIVEKLSIVCTGNLNKLINEFFVKDVAPVLYDELIKLVKEGRRHLIDEGVIKN